MQEFKNFRKKSNSKRKVGITFEVIGMIIASVILFAAISTYVSYDIFSNVMKNQMEDLIETTCYIAKDSVDGDLIDEYLKTEGQSEKSKEALNRLQTVCNDSEFNFLYIVRPDFENNKVLTVMSVKGEMYPQLEVYPVGHITDISTDDYVEAYKQVINGEKDTAFVYRLDMKRTYSHDAHVTGLCAIKNSMGEVTGIMCAEATFDWYKEAFNSYLARVLKWVAIILIFSISVCAIIVRYRVVVPFIKITDETMRFAKTNKIGDAPIAGEINRNNELGQLAKSIDHMENQITEYVDSITQMTADKEKLKAELNIATKIQAATLPHTFPPFPDRTEFEIFATMDPAKEVGGDFYDFFLIDDDHLAIVMADVSGKGVPAALFMMVCKIMIENYSSFSLNPEKTLELVNAKICENNEAEMFVTVWLGVLELSTGVLKTANAGHEDPAILRDGESFVLEKEKHGFVVGGMEGIKYKTHEYKLNPQDVLFMYTDGVPEATNANDELYGTDRMLEALNKYKNAENISDITKGVREDVDAFVLDAPQFDDMTMLVLRYLGNNRN